jgi:hypothetical protein
MTKAKGKLRNLYTVTQIARKGSSRRPNGHELREACRALGGAERPADFRGERPGIALSIVLLELRFRAVSCFWR